MSEKEFVRFSNAFADSDMWNSIIGGFLSLGCIIALETAGTKMFMKSKRRSMKVMFRREIYSRLNSGGSVKDLLSGNDLTDGELNRSEFKRKKVYLNRLIVPVLCRLVLLAAEITVIVLSGQTNVPQGKGTMYNHILTQVTGSSTDKKDTKGLCREYLEEKRHVATSGSLTTCARIKPVGQPYFDENGEPSYFSLTPEIDCLQNEISFKIEYNKNVGIVRKVFVEVTYSSYDGRIQTIFPFGSGSGICGPISINDLDYIYDQLVSIFDVPIRDQIKRFENKWEEKKFGDYSHSQYSMNAASIKIERGGVDKQGQAVAEALANIFLTRFTLKKTDEPIYGFDRQKGEYGNEVGEGPRLYQKNIVDQWVWLLITFVFAILAFIFDRINKEDPEFYLFRAFMAVNSMDPIAGPLAQDLDEKKDEYFFGRFKDESGWFTSVFKNVDFGLSNWIRLKTEKKMGGTSRLKKKSPSQKAVSSHHSNVEFGLSNWPSLKKEEQMKGHKNKHLSQYTKIHTPHSNNQLGLLHLTPVIKEKKIQEKKSPSKDEETLTPLSWSLCNTFSQDDKSVTPHSWPLCFTFSSE